MNARIPTKPTKPSKPTNDGPMEIFTGRITVSNPSVTFNWDKTFGRYAYGIRGFDLFFADKKNHEIAKVDLSLTSTRDSTNNTITVSASSFIMMKDSNDNISPDAYMDIVLVALEKDSTAGFVGMTDTVKAGTDDSQPSPTPGITSNIPVNAAASFITSWSAVAHDYSGPSDNNAHHKIESWHYDAGTASADGTTDIALSKLYADVTTNYNNGFYKYIRDAVIAIENPASGSSAIPPFGFQLIDASQQQVEFPYPVMEVKTVLASFENLGYQNSGDEPDSVKQFYARPLLSTIDHRDHTKVNFHWEGSHFGIPTIQGGWVGATELSRFPSTLQYLAIVIYDTSASG